MSQWYLPSLIQIANISTYAVVAMISMRILYLLFNERDSLHMRFEAANFSIQMPNMLRFGETNATSWLPEKLLDYALVIMSCNDRGGMQEHEMRDRYPGYIILKCNPQTASVDCLEAVPFLNFMIATHGRPVARKYIFMHNHVTAWHYSRNIYSQLALLLKSPYFERPFGGVFGKFHTGTGESTRDELRAVYSGVRLGVAFEDISHASRYPCCGTFFVDAARIAARPVKDYVTLRDNLRRWAAAHPRYRKKSASYFCGRFMEYTWHILLTGNLSTPAPPF